MPPRDRPRLHDFVKVADVNSMLRPLRATVLAFWVGLVCAAAMTPDSAQAQTFTRLQVLLPGETAAPGTGSGKLGTPDDQVAGVPFTVTVRACDNSWNSVTSVTDVVSLTSTEAGAGLPGPTALTSGTVSLTVTLNAGGSFTISATDDSDPTIPEATSAPVAAMVLQGFEFSRINQKNQYAGVPMAISLWAVDPNGDTVTGYDGPVDLEQSTSYGVGRIEPAQVTLSNGAWSGNLTMYRADETSINRGNVNIDATLPSNSAVNGTSDPFTVHPGPFSRVQIVVPGQNPLPGSQSGIIGFPATQSAGQTFAVEIFATDDYWNPVPSTDVVRVTSSDPGASTPVSGALSGGEFGYAQFTLSLGTVGTQTLTVNDQTNGSILSMTSDDIPVIPAGPDHFEIDPFPTPVTAGDTVTVTIRATDSGGNTVPGYAGNAILSANTGPGSISPEAIVFTNGVWTGPMVFRGAGGAVAFTCSDFGTPPHTGTSANFEVLAGPFTGLQVLLPGQTARGGTESGFEGTPTSHNAGSSFTLRVRAVDDYWNRVTGINDRVAISSSDSFMTAPAETTLSNGEISFPVTIYKAGYQTVTAVDLDTPGISPHTSSPVEILGGPYSRILILAPGEEIGYGTPDGRAGAATDQSINFSFTVTVYATDAWWNPVTGVSDMIRITSGDPLAELPPDTSLVDGRIDLSVRLSTGGFQQITATNLSQPGMPTSTTQVRAISSGFHLEAEVSTDTVQAGEPFTLTVKVTNDAGSVIQEINSWVDIEVQNASTRGPGLGTLKQTRFQLLQGKRSIQETYTYAETIIMIARDDAGNAPAVTEAVTVLPGTPASVELSSNPSWVGGNKHATVSAAVLDAYKNGIPDQAVTFTLLSGTGTLTPIDTATSSSGVARADFLSPRTPEIDRIRAVSNGLTDELDLETALVDPNAPGGHVTNYPNPFHPGESPTTIAYKLAADATVTLTYYTLSGDLVLRQQYLPGTQGGSVGLNEVYWDGKNGEGDWVSSGGYILVIEAEGDGETLHVMRRRIAVVR
jgi:hypothetical protein